MDLFSTGYDPAEWDLVSHRSDGEYLSLFEDSDDEGDNSNPESPYLSDHSDETDSQIEVLNFLDIKMMTSFTDINSLLNQRSQLQSKIATLTPGQFYLADRYTSQLEQLNQQILALQQPSVVNIHHYTPSDAEFEAAYTKPTVSSSLPAPAKGKVLITYYPLSNTTVQDNSLDDAIFILEEEIKEKEVLVRELWKTLKLQREELDFLRKKRNEEMEKDIFHDENTSLFSETKMIKGFDDRVVISIDIRPQGYLQYTLDAQIDTGAMNSCAKHGAIPEYYWQPVDLCFRAVNKTELKIKFICPDFLIYIQDCRIPVTFYSFDTGSNVLLGQDFVNKCLPLTVGLQYVQLTILGKSIKVPSKTVYENRIVEKETRKKVELSASSLVKIQKIVNNANKHGGEVIREIKDKIEKYCTSDYPDAFWTREQYFVNLPYKEDYIPRPQKASANHMSPTELEYCKKEIQELLQRKLIENSRSPWACPAFYVNKHSEQKRGKPRMVINYKALNDALLPLRFPLPSKELLFSKIGKCNVFSKFDLKSGFWQIGIFPADRYKTAFVVPQGQYQWRVMPFGLKNAPSEPLGLSSLLCQQAQ